ncbi:MAG: toprim domain-containing protein [Aequorivita sp.]
MKCSEANNLNLVDLLTKHNYLPTKETENIAWYLSPFRNENTASFRVDKRKNRWWDFGDGSGKTVVDLIVKLKKFTVVEALAYLNGKNTSYTFHQQEKLKPIDNSKIKITTVKAITHPALLNYLKSRNISLKAAQMICSEVHYSLSGKKKFSIGLQNVSKGWELRNKYYPNSSSPKDLTIIQNKNPLLIVAEGMFDALSLLTLDPSLPSRADLIVLNSVSFAEKAINYFQGYDRIELLLDNDSAGRKATENMLNKNKKCKNRSELYSAYKDLNEWLVNDMTQIDQRIDFCKGF